jgi:hypothetical protein
MTLLMRGSERFKSEYLQEAYYISVNGVLILENFA